MKQFIIILLASLAVSCMQEQTLIVDFKGFEGNEVEVTIQDYSEYFAGRKSKLARTYDLHDGKLYLNLNLSQPRVVHISHLDYLDANGYINSRGCIELFLKEGDKIAVTAYNHKDHITTKVKGSKINANLSIYLSIYLSTTILYAKNVAARKISMRLPKSLYRHTPTLLPQHLFFLILETTS